MIVMECHLLPHLKTLRPTARRVMPTAPDGFFAELKSFSNDSNHPDLESISDDND